MSDHQHEKSDDKAEGTAPDPVSDPGKPAPGADSDHPGGDTEGQPDYGGN